MKYKVVIDRPIEGLEVGVEYIVEKCEFSHLDDVGCPIHNLTINGNVYTDTVIGYKNMKEVQEKCCECDKLATWHYDPSSSREDKDNYFCDDHVSRGCSCNEVYPMYFDDLKDGYEPEPELDEYGNPIPFLDENGNGTRYKDKDGRDLPCIEYSQWDEEKQWYRM